MQQGQELLQKWDTRIARLHPRMEITGEGLTLGAGTVLAGMAKDEHGRPRLAFADEPRALALLATAYERPVKLYILAKLKRACELWDEGEKALAYIHLAHAGLPRCGPDQALRLFVADELIEAGVTPETLMRAQGFDTAPLALLKANFNPAQPRWPAGSGRDSGEWSGGAGNGRENGESTSDDAYITPVAFRNRREKGRHRGGGGWPDAIHDLLEWLLKPSKPGETEPAPEEKPPEPEVAKPESKPLETPEDEDLQLPEVDANKLHHIFDDPRHTLDELVTEFGSQESAFEAIAEATRDTVRSQGITGEYKIQVEVGGHLVSVKGRVANGIVNIGTVYIPWTP